MTLSASVSSPKESGLAAVIVQRADGSPVASVVNVGVLDHPVTGGPVVGFVARGHGRKLPTSGLGRVPRSCSALGGNALGGLLMMQSAASGTERPDGVRDVLSSRLTDAAAWGRRWIRRHPVT